MEIASPDEQNLHRLHHQGRLIVDGIQASPAFHEDNLEKIVVMLGHASRMVIQTGIGIILNFFLCVENHPL